MKTVSKKSWIYVVAVICTTVLLSACSPSLSNEERKVIEDEIPMYFVTNNLNITLTAYTAYIEECAAQYIKQMEEDINEPEYHVFLDIFNVAVDKKDKEQNLEKLKQYKDFCIEKTDLMKRNIIPDFTKLVTEELSENGIEAFMSCKTLLSFRDCKEVNDKGYIDMSEWADHNWLPSSIKAEDYDAYHNVVENIEDASANLSELFFGPYQSPEFNATAVLAMMVFVGYEFASDIPTPAYTWYDKDAKCWEIGFFNDKALDVVFIKKDGKVSYEILKEVPYNNDHFLDK